MNRSLLYLFLLIFPFQIIRAQPKYSRDTVIGTIKDVYSTFDLNQPGFYRYHSKEELAAFRDSIIATIKDSMTDIEVYRKIKPIISKIGCLHSGIGFTETLKQSLNLTSTLIPLQLYFLGDRAFLIKDYSLEKLFSPGTELISINGHSIAELLNILSAAIPSDGYNQTMKRLALYHLFPVWYRSMIEVNDHFSIGYVEAGLNKSAIIKGRAFGEIATAGFLNENKYERQLEFDIKAGTGWLTIHSFSNSDIKKGKQDFKRFIQIAFADLQSKGIKNLVLDLRYNTGGSDEHAALLTSYFFDKSFRYWDKIVVTEKIAGQIKGTVKLFYRKPVLDNDRWIWKKAKTVKDFDFYEPQEPAKDHFTGKVYVLINGFCMSSCADVAAILSANKKAIFIGEETGGGYQGNNSGMMPTSILRPMQLILTIPLQEYFNAVDPKVNFGRGTTPDYPLTPTVGDLIEKKDIYVELVSRLIGQ